MTIDEESRRQSEQREQDGQREQREAREQDGQREERDHPKEREKRESDVGYKKPPLWSRFQKDNPGNRTPRRKAVPDPASALRTVLCAPKRVNINGASRKVTAAEKAIHATVLRAMGGELSAIRQVLKHVERYRRQWQVEIDAAREVEQAARSADEPRYEPVAKKIEAHRKFLELARKFDEFLIKNGYSLPGEEYRRKRRPRILKAPDQALLWEKVLGRRYRIRVDGREVLMDPLTCFFRQLMRLTEQGKAGAMNLLSKCQRMMESRWAQEEFAAEQDFGALPPEVRRAREAFFRDMANRLEARLERRRIEAEREINSARDAESDLASGATGGEADGD